MPDVPDQWAAYNCEDYFSSPLAEHGYWDEPNQVWLIEPREHVEEEGDAEFLQVGRPGVDSIGFGYRRGLTGLWAFHRMEGEFRYLAPSVSRFLDDWVAGRVIL